MLNNYSWADTVWIKPIFNCKHVRFEWRHNTQLMVWPMYTCSSKLLFCSRTKLLSTISDYLWRQSAWLWLFWAQWNFTQNWMHQQNMLVLTPSLLPAELTNNTFCNHVDCAVNISTKLYKGQIRVYCKYPFCVRSISTLWAWKRREPKWGLTRRWCFCSNALSNSWELSTRCFKVTFCCDNSPLSLTLNKLHKVVTWNAFPTVLKEFPHMCTRMLFFYRIPNHFKWV